MSYLVKSGKFYSFIFLSLQTNVDIFLKEPKTKCLMEMQKHIPNPSSKSRNAKLSEIMDF